MFALRSVWHISIFALLCLAACDRPKKSGSGKPRSRADRTNYQYGELIRFGANGNAVRYTRGGWGETENERTCTNGYSAFLRVIPPAGDEPLRLRMKLTGLTNPPALPFQPVHVYVNDERVADWQVSEMADFIAIIPEALANRERLMIELRIPQANSSQTLGIGEDARTLGVCCYEAEITPTTREVVRELEQERAKDPLHGHENAYTPGTMLYLGAGANGQPYKASGWHTAEKNYTWTGSDPAFLELRLRPVEQPLRLRMRLGGMTKPELLPVQPTTVLVNGEKIADWPVAEVAEFAAVIPPEILNETGLMEIELRARAPVSPNELDVGDDTRPLGVRVEAFVIEEAPGETNPNVKTSLKARGSPDEGS